MMRLICRVSVRPTDVHVLPPSAVFQTPSPCETLPRIGYSPPPTYTTSGADGATAIAPIVPPKYLSVTGAHDCPALIDLKTPPPVVPIQNSSGRDGFPVPATDLPPRYGPISRQRSPVKTSESRCAKSDAGSTRIAASEARRFTRTGTSSRRLRLV